MVNRSEITDNMPPLKRYLPILNMYSESCTATSQETCTVFTFSKPASHMASTELDMP